MAKKKETEEERYRREQAELNKPPREQDPYVTGNRNQPSYINGSGSEDPDEPEQSPLSKLIFGDKKKGKKKK